MCEFALRKVEEIAQVISECDEMLNIYKMNVCVSCILFSDD